MHSVELGSKTLSLLASVFSHGSAVTQGVATRLLGDMVAKRLANAGHERAWDDFKHDPASHVTTECILQQILHEDPGFQIELEDALIAAMHENARSLDQHGTIQITGPGRAQIGNRGDAITGSRIANRGGTYNERTRINNKNTKKTSSGPIVLGMVALIVLAILLIKGVPAVLHHLGDGDLTANSTCQDFLNASPTAQQKALYNLAGKYNVPEYATPLGEPNVTEYCVSDPSGPLWQFFAKAEKADGGG